MPQASTSILLVEDTASLAMVYRDYLRSAGLDTDHVDTGKAALEALAGQHYPVILLDLKLPDMDGFDILRHIRRARVESSVVVITAHGSVNLAVEAMQLGAADFLVKPFSKERLLTTVGNARERARLKETVHALTDDFGRSRFHGFVGQSPVMQSVYRAIESVAKSRASVFITGESGTGKEVCAEAIHRAGPRADQPFVPLNCGAIPKDLIESELFGHTKGAFSGATTDRDGAAQTADGGILFLDEICEMDIALQVKLLRFLQTGKVQKVGSSVLQPVDVRVISATNRDPVAEVEAGRFREDLYYRLFVVPIHLPPLREREGDVLDIAAAFLQRFAAEDGKRFARFSAEAEEMLLRHDWPGNVRELQNVIRNVVVLHDGDEVTPEMLPPLFRPQTRRNGAATPAGAIPPSLPREPAMDGAMIPLGRSLQEIERDVIETTIRLHGGSIPKAARALSISPSTIYRKKETWDAA